ncbi:hypothetical protein B0H11DRAFT_2204747 [Mycena galericulata]|nr:hypothetical protein B0H11DRAFT_2204747 [Mycena galericulata]
MASLTPTDTRDASPPVSKHARRVVEIIESLSNDHYANGVRTATIPDVDSETWNELERLGYEEAREHRLIILGLNTTSTRMSSPHRARRPCTRASDPSFAQSITFNSPQAVKISLSSITGQSCSRAALLTSPRTSSSTRAPGTYWNKHLVIGECGWAQSASALAKKAEGWLEELDVVLSMHLHLQATRGATPEDPPPELYRIKSRGEVLSAARTPLSAVTFEGHTWAKAIEKISLTLYHCEYETETYDLTPAPPGDTSRAAALEKAQSAVTSYLRSELTKCMTEERFQQCFTPEKPFALGWDNFYRESERGLFTEAYRRYERWAWTAISASAALSGGGEEETKSSRSA